MAEANMSAIQDHFSCPVCLDLLKDPVTILCGHSFCTVCINDCWDQEDQKGVYSCPQCRQTFTPRPVVIKNTMLADVVETLRKTGVQATCPDHCLAGPEDVECDFCTERKSKAVKSCLVCLASFCETHLQPHYKSSAFKKHKLVEVSRRLQQQICSQHDKLLEVYCRTDQQCICMFCMLDKHKGHDTVSAAAGRPEKQGQVLEVQQKYKQEIQAREQELQDLTKAVEFHKRFAQTAMQRTERVFTELIKSIERRHCEVTDLIRAQEKAEVSRAEKIIKQLEQEIAKLKTRDTELEELSDTQDHIHFLQSFGNLVTPSKSKDTIALTSLLSSERVVKSVSQLQEKLDAFFKDQFEKMSSDVKKVLNFSPQSRKECLQYFCQLSLDPITADQRLHLSDSNRMVTYNALHGMLKVQHPAFLFKDQTKDENTERLYPSYSQVLCKESVCEPCYWEVECRGFDVSIAVAYKDIITKETGYECAFGHNAKSWNLLCSSSGYSFLHNSQETKISIKPSSSRIGVFVDQKAGILSFYSVSDKIKLLHRVLTTFTQPLYPGFTVNCNSTLKLFH